MNWHAFILLVPLVVAIACQNEVPAELSANSPQYLALCQGGAAQPSAPDTAQKAVIVQADTGIMDSEYHHISNERRATLPSEVRYVICLLRSEKVVGHYQPGNAEALQRIWEARLIDLVNGLEESRSFYGDMPPGLISGPDNPVENEEYGSEPKDEFRKWVRGNVQSSPARQEADSAARSAESHYDRGADLLEKDAYTEALAAFDQAIRLLPSYANAHRDRGRSLLLVGRHQEALAAFDQAITLQDDDAAAHQGRALALTCLGRPDEALTAYDSAIALFSEDAGMHDQRGITLLYLARYDEALTAFDRAIVLAPDDASIPNNRGWALHEMGRDRDALEALDQAIALAPDFGLAQQNRGIVLESLGRYEEAQAAHDSAANLETNLVESLETAADRRVPLGCS